ncbi:unnamed protein product [Cochlearia groenlandica]
MEIIAAGDIDTGTDLFPPLSPLTFSLYDSFLSSHCSSCFSLLLPSPPPQSPTSLYCSAAACSSVTDSPLIIPPPDIYPILSSDIKATLRLLLLSSSSVATASSLPHRFGNLLTNHHRLISDPSISVAIRRAANFIAVVRGNWVNGKDTEVEEAALCSVLTNAVDVQDSTGRGLGIAVYDSRFSWINHSCSPNTCYRFLISPSSSSSSSLDSLTTTTSFVNFYNMFLLFFCEGQTIGCGPKVIVRSFKKIKIGEEITISYIDLLQPKGLRQADLLSKYRFMCNCGRCAAFPPAYVDSILEKVLTLEPEETIVCQHHITTDKDEAMSLMTDHIKEAIDDFLSDNIDPKTCCETIENVLCHGSSDSQAHHHHLLLHPIHHISLDAYVTLGTAYKLRSIDYETNTKKAFEMIRISAAYSLFLACVTHHLFSQEPSLAIASASFWKSAGESLLDLSRTKSYVKCSKCVLFVETRGSQRDVEDTSEQILRCINDISWVSWSFLNRGCRYLEKFKSPFDFSSTRINCEGEESSEDQRVNIQLLCFHCLLYADLLNDICYGHKSHLLSHN